MAKPELLYLRIAGLIEQQVKSGMLKTADKLPSLRTICHEHGVSMNTAVQSYIHLEKKGLIESKPKSGYVVSFTHREILAPPATSKPILMYGTENKEEIIQAVISNRKRSKISLSGGTPDLSLLPIAKLNKAMIHALRTMPDSGVNYDHRGNENLKRQIAKRSISWGGKLKSDEIVTTSGSIEAISFCIMALAKAGDTIVVESPVYFGILQIAQSLGLKIIELPTNPITGIEVDALKKVLEKRKVKLCLLVSNFNNPLGSCMPDEHKREVVKLLEKHNVPLIEDDLYGDLFFGNQRPSSCKTYDESGMVLWCGSFSKTLSSGYRVGWVAPGKFKEQVSRIKLYHTISTNALSHEAVAYFLEMGRYDLHLQKLRQTLQTNMFQYFRCLKEHFPDDTRISQPKGGFVMWVELDKRKNALALYDQAIQQGISIAPGTMFTLQNLYENCFRLSYGLKWEPRVEAALRALGRLVEN